MSWPDEVKRIRDAVVMRMDMSIRGTEVPDSTRDAAAGLTDDPELIAAVMDEIFGLGPLEPLLRDQEVRAILVEGPDAVRVERNGAEVHVARGFRDDEHVRRIMERILVSIGLALPSAETPNVEATLEDGSRLVATWHDGRPLFTVRRPAV